MEKLANLKNKIAWWHAILFIAVAAFGTYGFMFLTRANFSASQVSLSLEGPPTFKAQESVEFEVRIENRSKFELANAAIFITLPEFLSFQDGSGGEKRIEVGEVGKKNDEAIKLSVFASETQKEGAIKARAEYMPGNLSGTFETRASAPVAVASLPLTVIFDIPQKAVSGQQLRGSFHFVAEHELEELPLASRIILPEEFVLRDAEPKPEGTTTWVFEKVEPKEGYAVNFEGVIRGSESETKSFDLLFGSLNNEGIFSAQYKISREVEISSSPLEFSQTVNGMDEYISSPPDNLNFRIDYKNKSGVDIEDVSITANLEGEAFDLSALNAGIGYFNSNTRTIIWNKNFTSDLSRLERGASGSVEFSVPLKQSPAILSYKDKNILLKSTAVMDSANVPLALRGLSLRAESEARVKLRTSAELSSKAHYYEGPFSNSGSIPPRAGEKTTYTISWQMKNSFNEMSDVRVEAPLPSYVEFEGKSYPFANKLSYDSQNHSMVWDVGGLSWGVGYIFPAETVAFQVSITPSDDMRGQTPELLERAKISGTDTFTEEFVDSFASALDTTLPNDVGIRNGDGVVE